MNKPIKDLSPKEFEQWIQSKGQPLYRRNQIERWIYKKDISSFLDMSNLPKSLRESLAAYFSYFSLKKIKKETTSDGIVKFLFETLDEEHVESVLIPDRDRTTLCVSTQIGCRMGCNFCLTGIQGFKRNLSRSEILDQVLLVRKWMREDGKKLTNVVFMGMGEPLDNYDHSLAALKALVSSEGAGMSHRKVTLSTVGLIPQIKRLAQEGLDLTLAVSVNATDNKTRNRIMPINRRYPLEKLMATLREYPLPSRKRFTLEYVLLKDINHSKEDALRLAKLTKGLRIKVNLIPYNTFPGTCYASPSERDILTFQAMLRQKGISTFIRRSRGQEISAACGMLRWREAE